MRVAVAISGGVDSLRAATLLGEQGHDVFGIHMRLLPCAPHGGGACRPEDAIRSLLSSFGIPLVVVDMQESFESAVINPFLDSYLRGITPNPCVVCNPEIKFGLLLEQAALHGAERFATGHYARILEPGPASALFRLCRGRDHTKDQSYFLCGLTQAQLARTLFPLGELTKRDVLLWAEESGLSSTLPAESQEICFIPEGDYLEFLRERRKAELPPGGLIVDLEGRRLGEHRGIFAYTVGQRRGLGIASSAPYYVVRVDPSSNTVVVGRSEDLNSRELLATGVRWVSIDPPKEPIRCQARIRHKHQASPAVVIPLGAMRASVSFETPQRALTPGQAAVFYDGDVLLGGGTIEASV